MKILFIKSATQPIEVTYAHLDERTKALEIIDRFVPTIEEQASTALLPAIAELLAHNAVSLWEVERVYVASGPGSYTGARIAVTVVKTMHQLIPSIAVFDTSVLQIMKAAQNEQPEYAVIQARKNTYYLQKRSLTNKELPVIIKTAQLLDLLSSSCYVNGRFFEEGVSEVTGIGYDVDYDCWLESSTRVVDVFAWVPYYVEDVSIG